MSEPKVLEVSSSEKKELEKGESGLSSASVGTEARESRQSESAQTGVNLTNLRGVATGNTEERGLRVTRETPSGVYVHRDGAGEGFSRSVDDKKQIVNMILVKEVKKLIGMSEAELKTYIDSVIKTIREGQYVVVDTTVYPTLEDFLASTGEQGTVYLYPLDNAGNNYDQYIWENGVWMALGSTQLDLSDYYTKEEADPRMFNVINASDIASNTLTQAQYDLITNGKPTLIKGTFLAGDNLLIAPLKQWTSNNNYYGFCTYSDGYGRFFIKNFIVSENKVCSLASNGVRMGYNGRIVIDSVETLNGKTVPAYPTTNTEKRVLTIGANGGNLAWEDPFKPASVAVADGETISDNTLKQNIVGHYPIVLNGFTCYFSCDDGTNYQYTSIRYDSGANRNHINVITINKSSWVATFHTSDIALS